MTALQLESGLAALQVPLVWKSMFVFNVTSAMLAGWVCIETLKKDLTQAHQIEITEELLAEVPRALRVSFRNSNTIDPPQATSHPLPHMTQQILAANGTTATSRRVEAISKGRPPVSVVELEGETYRCARADILQLRRQLADTEARAQAALAEKVTLEAFRRKTNQATSTKSSKLKVQGRRPWI